MALDVLEDLEASDKDIDEMTYAAAITAICSGEEWHQAMALFQHMQRWGDSESINSAFGSIGDVQDV
eukprot:g15711.t1